MCLVVLGSIAFFSRLFLLFAANVIPGSTGVELLECKLFKQIWSLYFLFSRRSSLATGIFVVSGLPGISISSSVSCSAKCLSFLE